MIHNCIEQVVPIRIFFFDEIDFPLAIPFLELLLSQYSVFRAIVWFEVHQLMYFVSFGKAFNEIHTMFCDSFR